jgi:transposase-like protein
MKMKETKYNCKYCGIELEEDEIELIEEKHITFRCDWCRCTFKYDIPLDKG